jgi:N-acetylglucosamine kinase-like BadF-type ATPase
VILLGESGSTKTSWAVISGADTTPIIIHTLGLNPNYNDRNTIDAAFNQQDFDPFRSQIQSVYFYGSGVGSDANNALMTELLMKAFPAANAIVHNDLMAAARSLAGKSSGIICILGTGSNACSYDGLIIDDDQHSLGYILGDEGSGFHLGRQVLSDYLYGLMPEKLSHAFSQQFKINRNDVIKQVYHQSSPNRYIASFTPFLSGHRGDLYIENLLRKEFELFYQAYIKRFAAQPELQVYATGSVARVFQDVFREVCISHGRIVARVEANPLNGLIDYHLNYM